ncbi:hypothetical protein [Pseudomonas sp. MS15a(2019)]|uniref:hypothetical protein n=1 Tax=Pseudomonas sp. MS15a(2019) TaxID=2579938 RepID=UPI0015645038|nr:hypothetical protein [Pseudomonas sp. MS15a(2019)]NRH41502.1 hypothetical protein [Pseudomonas sp. MS15a(2019)]
MLAACLPWDLPVKPFFRVETVAASAAPMATDQRRQSTLVILPGQRQEGAAYRSRWPSFRLSKRAGCVSQQGRPRLGVESA